MKAVIVLIFGLLLTCSIVAQTFDTTEYPDAKKEQTTQTNQNEQARMVTELRPISSWEFSLSLIVLGFGTLVIALEVILVFKRRISEENIVKFIVVTLIITATLFLITAGYNNNQIAPAMGLLGTIAGYLLGRQDKTEKSNT